LAGSCCAAAVVLLLLLQPLLCVMQCAMEARPATHTSAQAAPTDPFLCHMSGPQSPHPLIIPAFWPGVLPALALLAAAHALVCRLMPAAPPGLVAHRWVPPLPPPRRSCAA
jgi:hypothetical protein